MSADEYVPDEEQVRAWCREGTGDYPDVMDEWLDRFLARVRRDAQAEAWDDCAHEADRRWLIGGQSAAILHDRNPYRETGDSDEHR